MFIDKDGNSYGSIGGGNVEFQALKYAPEAQHGEIRKYNLSNQGGANLGMICGGEVEVLYELLQISTEPTATPRKQKKADKAGQNAYLNYL